MHARQTLLLAISSALRNGIRAGMSPVEPAWCVQELGMVMPACKPRTLEVRARRSEVCGQPEKDPFLPRMTLNLIFS